MTVRSTAEASANPMLTGKHVLVFFVIFFAAIFAVNGYFLFSALSTHTGVVSVEPYRKGLAYNQRIAADEAQKALGWAETLTADMKGNISLRLVDQANSAVTGLRVSAVLGRPSTGQFDRTLTLSQQGDGSYSATSAPLDNGTWVIAIEARDGNTDGNPIYRSRRRLWLKP